jgi:predicted phage tail protein
MCALEHRFGFQFIRDVSEHSWHLIDGKRISRANDIGEDELDGRTLISDTFHFLPVVAGASSVLRFIVGIVLIVVGAYFGQTWMIQLGAGLALGGVASMLAPKPAGPAKAAELNKSFVFDGAPNLNTQGDGKPMVYGRVRRVGSYYVSTDFSNDIIIPYYPPPPEPTAPNRRGT